MHLVDRRTKLRVGVGVLGALGERNSAALCKLFQRLVKADPFDLLNKLEDVAPLSAPEALIELMVGMDAKRRGLFGMERAQTQIALGAAYPLETDILPHDADDVNRSFDLRREIQ